MGFLAGLLGLNSNSSSKSKSSGGKFKCGDWVEVIDDGIEGEVVDISGNEYYVEFGNGKVNTYTARELRKRF